jgi:2-amino-4-hydroxy-6-hydroxymethyldihydropteridine diphosphokinase
VKLLSGYGEINGVSSVWESEAVGTEGPNYLNACVSFTSSFEQADLKEKVIQAVEQQLGRRRSEDKFAPRPMDIDIVLFDDRLVAKSGWDLAYVMIPLAELYPEYRNPVTGETASERAKCLRQAVWLEMRRGVLS